MDDKAKLWIGMGASLVVLITAFYLLMKGSDYTLLYAIMFIVIVPIILMGVYMMITGKGSFLIAGYNTSPSNVKAAYDDEALSRFTGALVTVICVMLLLAIASFTSLGVRWFGILALIIMVAVLVVGIVYANTGGRFLKEPLAPIQPPTDAERKRNRNIVIAAVGVSLILVGGVVVAMFAYGDVSASLEDDRLTVKAPMVDEAVMYSDITEGDVDLRYGLDLGTRTGGWGSPKIKSGNFNNTEFGAYKLASYSKVNAYIVIDRGGSWLVFNLDSVEKTQQFYGSLIDELNSINSP